MNNKKGFTLIEILAAVIIIGVLSVMAVPLYEKTIERSRLTEARTLMNRLADAKQEAMSDMGCGSYDRTNTHCPQLQHLRVAFKNHNGTNYNTGNLAGIKR